MGRKRIAALAVGLIVVAVAAACLAVRGRASVDWAAVRAALRTRQTLHGQGRYRGDGTEWDFAIWGAVRPDGSYVSRGMMMPAGGETTGEPSPEALRISSAMDYLGQEGLVTQLLASPGKPARAKPGQWDGERVLLAELEKDGLIWVIALKPETSLIVGLEAYVMEDGGGRKLRGRCEYAYDQPLPPGFDQAPE